MLSNSLGFTFYSVSSFSTSFTIDLTSSQSLCESIPSYISLVNSAIRIFISFFWFCILSSNLGFSTFLRWFITSLHCLSSSRFFFRNLRTFYKKKRCLKSLKSFSWFSNLPLFSFPFCLSRKEALETIFPLQRI